MKFALFAGSAQPEYVLSRRMTETRFSRPFALSPFAAVAAAFVALAGLGCDRPPSPAAAREWTASDHDHADEKGKVLSGESSTGSGKRGAKGDKTKAADDVAAVVDLTWQKQCAVCHGVAGRGDGPNGPLVKAPDLTAADWQAKITDAEMAATIKGGRGLMPKFDLGDDVIAGLVARVRALGGRGPAAPVAPAPSGSAKGR